MAPPSSSSSSSSWHKTRYFHDLSCKPKPGVTPSRGQQQGTATAPTTTSPFMVLFEVCHYNDAAVTDMNQGHFAVAIRMLSQAAEKIAALTPADYAKVEGRTCTFQETLPGQASLPRLLEVRHECANETSNLFTNALRLCNSNFTATFSSAAAVVHFNLGLTRHIQAMEAMGQNGKVATSILKVAAKHYKTALSPSSNHHKTLVTTHNALPKLVQVAALCNLSQCSSAISTEDSRKHQDQFQEAFGLLDTQEDRNIFTNCVSSAATAA